LLLDVCDAFVPKVIQLKKEGQETQPILMKYVAYIAILSTIIVLVVHSFSRNGCSFDVWKSIPIAFLLWKYVLVTLFLLLQIFLPTIFYQMNTFRLWSQH
jgi:hypothetical protein